MHLLTHVRNKSLQVIHCFQEASDLSYIFWGSGMFYCSYLPGINLQPFFGDLVSHECYRVNFHDHFVHVQTYPCRVITLNEFFYVLVMLLRILPVNYDVICDANNTLKIFKHF